jgi:uncharacterized membrane protein
LTLGRASGKSPALEPRRRAMTNPSLSAGSGQRPRLERRLAAIRRQPRLLICAVAMVVAFLALPDDLRLATRALIAWNLAALLFIVLIGWMLARSTEQAIQARAAQEDENPWALQAVGTLAACAALAAIMWELAAVKDLTGWTKGAHIGLAGATILTAWTFIHLLYALHYAHEYYGDRRDAAGEAVEDRKGLRFPGERNPTYEDFLYFSFVIGCACQTADVETVSPAMRRTALLHGIVAFFFNTIILALTINIGAGLV